MEDAYGEEGGEGPPPAPADSSQEQQPPNKLESVSSLAELRTRRSVKFKGGGSNSPRSSRSTSRRSSGNVMDSSAASTDTTVIPEGQKAGGAAGEAPAHDDAPTSSSISCISTADNNPEEEDPSPPLLHRQTSRAQRLESSVYSYGNKPNPKALDAAVRSMESSVLLKKPLQGDGPPEPVASPASCKDLSGFYQKLLGEDWEEQLQQISSQEVENVFARDTGSPTMSMEIPGLNIPSVGENYQGRVRQRIRRRDVNSNQDISDQVADDLQVADDEPLISADEIVEIRESAWRPAGEAIPPLNTLGLGYHQAWDVGKRGCLAAKLDVIWTPALASNRLRFFVMDGTDPESFLTYYSKSDLQAARGLSSEKLGSISAWDLRDGHWTYPKAKVFIRRSDKHNRDCILENFAADFYDAMLICLWEMETQSKIEQLKNQRRQERTRGRLSVCGPPGAYSGNRLSAAVVSYRGNGLALHLPTNRGAGGPPVGAPRGPRRPRDSIMVSITQAFRSVGEKDGAAPWLEERIERQRERQRQSEASSPALPNGIQRDSSPSAGQGLTASSNAARKQQQQQGQGRRPSEALRMTRRPPGVPVGPHGAETPVLSPQLSPRDGAVRPHAMFG